MPDVRERIPQPPSIAIIGAWDGRGEPGYRETRGRSRERLELVRTWPRRVAISLLAFCTLWFGFLAVWYAAVLGAGGPWAMLLVPLIHVAAGLGLLYWALSGLLNRTRIVIEGLTLTVSHGPLPWPGNRVPDVDRVQQLSCTGGPWSTRA